MGEPGPGLCDEGAVLCPARQLLEGLNCVTRVPAFERFSPDAEQTTLDRSIRREEKKLLKGVVRESGGDCVGYEEACASVVPKRGFDVPEEKLKEWPSVAGLARYVLQLGFDERHVLRLLPGEDDVLSDSRGIVLGSFVYLT